MEFNDPTGLSGIIQATEVKLFGDSGFGQISQNPNRLQLFTNLANEALGRYAILALKSDNSWAFDDNNYTDFPIGTTDLIAGQPDYTLNTQQIEIEQVEVRDPTNTIWTALPELDERKFAELHYSQSQYNNNIAAIPREHVKKGNSIYLYPTPVYSITTAINGNGGLRVRFKRPPSYYLPTDTVKVAGINRLHHDYISDYMAWKYASMRGLPVAAVLAPMVVRWEEQDIPDAYNSRDLEKPRSMTIIYRSPR